MNDQMEDHRKVTLDLISEMRMDINIYMAAMMNELDIYMAKMEMIFDKSSARERAQKENNIFETDALKVSTLKTDSDESNDICIDNAICEIEVNELGTIAKDGLSSNIEKFLIHDDMEWDEDISFDHSDYQPVVYDGFQQSDLGFEKGLAINVVGVQADVYIRKLANKLVCESAAQDVMGSLQGGKCSVLSRGTGFIKRVSDGSSMILRTAKRTLWDPGIYDDFHVSGVRR
jgi:hypothetical protein